MAKRAVGLLRLSVCRARILHAGLPAALRSVLVFTPLIYSFMIRAAGSD
jgi:hypothetical protein